MDINDMIFTLYGKEYEIIPLERPIDVSADNETEFPTKITHKIKGFDEDIYLVEEQTGEDEIGFSFGYFIGDTGLFVSVIDEEIIEIAETLIFTALNMSNKQND
jgi:hypothetical protein